MGKSFKIVHADRLPLGTCERIMDLGPKGKTVGGMEMQIQALMNLLNVIRRTAVELFSRTVFKMGPEISNC